MTGVELAAQRQRVFTATTTVVEYLRSGKPCAEIVGLLHALRSDAEILFDSEEQAMRAEGFPSIDVHQRDHEKLRKVLADLSSAVKDLPEIQERRDRFAQHFHRKFFAKMVCHIQSLDRELSGFISGAEGSS